MWKHAKWITRSLVSQDVCPLFRKTWVLDKKVDKALLSLSALGVYEATLNGKKVGQQVLAPGWTSYDHRIQYQTYDVTAYLTKQNVLDVTVGKGWYASPMPGWKMTEDKARRMKRHTGMIAELALTFDDGSSLGITSDETWKTAESPFRFAEIYDGVVYDATFVPNDWDSVTVFDGPTGRLIPQEGEEIREMEEVVAKEIIITPKGETVVDFGQEVTGVFSFTVDAKAGDRISILCGEVLDRAGNFYHENYRSAKAMVAYICIQGKQTWQPSLTFFGFRYLKLVSFPGNVSAQQFRAHAVYSNMHQTGFFTCGLSEVNQLFSNILWGQKGNFLDVPTDCPQRDERLGWTGDAQVFAKTATYNYDVERFYRKWLHDVAADQRENGAIGQVIPDYLPECEPSAAWSDVGTICPWQVYQTYGDRQVLADQFQSMKRWVDYITTTTTTPGLWMGGTHFGDWLGLDAAEGSYRGASRDDLIASAYYARSTALVIKAGNVLGLDVSTYTRLLSHIVEMFQKTFPLYKTQTEHVVALQCGLAENPQKTADDLAQMIKDDGYQMKTGFVGTGYLLHALSFYGHVDIAYTLLLRREYPSWLYPVTKGATTIWEHWDGIKQDGSFWSADMNSFNHYAYGAVADWLYEVAAGIRHEEDAPGFRTAIIEPHPDKRVGWLDVSLQTRHGVIRSKWGYRGETVRYEIHVDMPTTIIINHHTQHVKPGMYTFWG